MGKQVVLIKLACAIACISVPPAVAVPLDSQRAVEFNPKSIASNWRPVLFDIFKSISISPHDLAANPDLLAVAELKNMWSMADSIGAEPSLRFSEPFINLLDNFQYGITPRSLRTYDADSQRTLVLEAVIMVVRKSRREADEALAEIPDVLAQNDLEALISMKDRLLGLQERWVYLDEGRQEKISQAASGISHQIIVMRRWEATESVGSLLGSDWPKSVLIDRLSSHIDKIRQQMAAAQRLDERFHRHSHADEFHEAELALCELGEVGDIGFIESSMPGLTPDQRQTLKELRTYVPGLDPDRVRFIQFPDPGMPASLENILFLDGRLAGRMTPFRLHEDLPLERYAFAISPGLAMHEGFHQGDSARGVDIDLALQDKAKLKVGAAKTFGAALVEGLNELKTRRSQARVLADGASENPSTWLRLLHELKPRCFDKDIRTMNLPEIEAAIEQWQEHHPYSPYVNLIRALEKTLKFAGGIWAVEDIVLHGKLDILMDVVGDSWDALILLAEKLHEANTMTNHYSTVEPSTLKNAALKMIQKIFSGQPVSVNDVHDRIRELPAEHDAI